MASPIIIPKKSTIAGKVPLPGQLSSGEVCVNWADQVWQGKHPTTLGVVPIGAPALHSHDQLISSDNLSADLELQNDGSIIITEGTVATTLAFSSTVARTITLPDKTGTVALRGGDAVFSETEPINPYPGLRWVNTITGRVYEWYTWPNVAGGFFQEWVEFGSAGGGSSGGLSGPVNYGDILNAPALAGVATSGSYGDLLNAPILGRVATSDKYGDLKEIPSTFEPSAHSHTISQVTSLQASLNARYTKAEVDAFLLNKQAVGSYSAAGHKHDASDITTGKISVDRLPVIPTGASVVLASLIPNMTTANEDAIASGTIVFASDGSRYVYTGVGDKKSVNSYIELADITPQWSAIAGVPSAFPPSAHFHNVTDIADFDVGVSNYLLAYPPSASVSVSDNSGLVTNSGVLSTLYNTTIGDSVVSAQVGGASSKAASTWKTLTIVQVLDQILFPTVLPKIKTAKSASLAVSGSAGVLEIGVSYLRTLTASFNRGQIENGDGSLGPALVGAVNATSGYTFSGTGITSTSQNGSALTFTTAIVEGANAWSVSVSHGEGTGAYFDNKGSTQTNLNSSRVSGSSTDGTTAITGVYPYFYLRSANQLTADQFVAAIQNGTATAQIASSAGALSIDYALQQQYIYVAYPTSNLYGAKTSYEASVNDFGAITLVFEPVVTKSVTRSQSGTPIWTKTYHVHVGKYKTTSTNAKIILK